MTPWEGRSKKSSGGRSFSKSGDPSASERLFSMLYDELRGIAAQHMRGERGSHTLQATALVHEAYLRLAADEHLAAADRINFLSVASRAIRQVLIDHARRRKAEKRGGRLEKVTLDESLRWSESNELDLLELDGALSRLAALDPRQARIVELRFFAGLSVEEVADALGVTSRTVRNHWRMAKAWLRLELATDGAR